MKIIQDAFVAAANLAYSAGEKAVQYMGKVYQYFSGSSASAAAKQVNEKASHIVDVEKEMETAMAQFNMANKKFSTATNFSKPLVKLPSDSELLNELGISSGKF